MKPGNRARITVIEDFLAIARAIERRESAPWTIGQIASEVGADPRTVFRWLSDFREHCGLVTDRIGGGASTALRTVGRWSILGYVRKRLKSP